MNYLTLNTVIELGCLLIASYCIARDKRMAWRSQFYFLAVICITEMLGIYLKSQHRSNSWLYNLLLLFELSFISFMFNELLRKYIKPRPMIFIGAALVVIVYLYELLLHGPMKRHNLSNIVFGVTVVLYSLYYFYLLLKDDEFVKLSISSSFWWVMGTLFFYFGFSSLNIFYPLLSKVLERPNVAFSYTFKALNILLYSCWSYSFICRKWWTDRLES